MNIKYIQSYMYSYLASKWFTFREKETVKSEIALIFYLFIYLHRVYIFIIYHDDMLYLIYSYGFKIIAHLKLTIAIFIFFRGFHNKSVIGQKAFLSGSWGWSVLPSDSMAALNALLFNGQIMYFNTTDLCVYHSIRFAFNESEA